MPSFIYFHICAYRHFEEIIRSMMHIIISSNCLQYIDEIRYCVVGPDYQRAIQIMTEYPKTKLLQSDPYAMHQYERYTLHRLHQDCVSFQREEKKCNILYIHSKGITRPRTTNISVWRDAMLKILTMYAHQWIAMLESGRADAIGSFYLDQPFRHFSGNFWWASSSYIIRLPTPIGPNYLDPEAWIGLFHGRGRLHNVSRYNLSNKYDYTVNVHELLNRVVF